MLGNFYLHSYVQILRLLIGVRIEYIPDQGRRPDPNPIAIHRIRLLGCTNFSTSALHCSWLPPTPKINKQKKYSENQISLLRFTEQCIFQSSLKSFKTQHKTQHNTHTQQPCISSCSSRNGWFVGQKKSQCNTCYGDNYQPSH